MSALSKPAPASSGPNAALIAKLIAEPHAFELTTAIRLAERAGRPFEIVTEASSMLAPAAITAVTEKDGVLRFHVSTSGLIGAFGALPPAYTQAALEEERRRSRSFRAFLDLFAVPLFQFMLAAREKYRLGRLLRWNSLTHANRIVGALRSLAGFSPPPVRKANRLGDEVILRYGGYFANRNRNAASLGAMLSDFLGLRAEVEQFHPRWVTVADTERSRLGAPRGTQLGVDTMAGAAIRDHAGNFRIVIGPVAYADFLSLEPGSPRLGDVMALTRLFVGPSLHFDVQIILRKEDVPFCQLGDKIHPPRLGWNSWARTAPSPVDSRDAIVQAPAL